MLNIQVDAVREQLHVESNFADMDAEDILFEVRTLAQTALNEVAAAAVDKGMPAAEAPAMVRLLAESLRDALGADTDFAGYYAQRAKPDR